MSSTGTHCTYLAACCVPAQAAKAAVKPRANAAGDEAKAGKPGQGAGLGWEIGQWGHFCTVKHRTPYRTKVLQSYATYSTAQHFTSMCTNLPTCLHFARHLPPPLHSRFPRTQYPPHHIPTPTHAAAKRKPRGKKVLSDSDGDSDDASASEPDLSDDNDDVFEIDAPSPAVAPKVGHAGCPRTRNRQRACAVLLRPYPSCLDVFVARAACHTTPRSQQQGGAVSTVDCVLCAPLCAVRQC